LIALDVASGDELGRLESGHGFVARAAVAHGRGFIVTNSGTLLAMRVRPVEAQGAPAREGR
jgi:hypothetical protein